ncbi:MAG TPA: hypothetical protein VIK81_03000, partial [Patescibacteria group bacterium]
MSKTIILLLITTLVLRLLLSFFPSFEFDQGAFRIWSNRLAESGPTKFYSSEIFTNNPVGFLYLLWIWGLIKENLLNGSAFFNANQNYDLLLKLPANISDLIIASLIYLAVKKRIGQKAGIIGFLLFAI